MDDGLTVQVSHSEVHAKFRDERFQGFDLTIRPDVVYKFSTLWVVDYILIDIEFSLLRDKSYR